MMVSKRHFLFQGLLFRFHVKLWGCNKPLSTESLEIFLHCFNGDPVFEWNLLDVNLSRLLEDPATTQLGIVEGVKKGRSPSKKLPGFSEGSQLL